MHVCPEPRVTLLVKFHCKIRKSDEIKRFMLSIHFYNNFFLLHKLVGNLSLRPAHKLEGSDHISGTNLLYFITTYGNNMRLFPRLP